MKLRQKLVVGALTVVMLLLAVSAMGLIQLRTRPLTVERLAAPDIQK
jgi:thiol:disulfide interchange protein